MASLRSRTRGDGTTAHAVLYQVNGRQSSVTFDDVREAELFRDMANLHGPARALELAGIGETKKTAPGGITVSMWLTRHIDHLTGVEQKTIDDYRRYVRRDIGFLGDIPLAALEEDDIGVWVTQLQELGNSPKTIKNKHGFLSGALSAAVPKFIPANPAAGRRLPRGDGDDDELRMLTRDEYEQLLAATTEPWRPLVEFLVMSGCRWGEAVALKPGDVDRVNGSVKIRRAWKHSSAGYQIGPPKTKRSRRTIKIPKRVLDELDYSNEWLFVNRTGGPVRYHGFKRRVWDKAVTRSGLQPPPTPHDLRHTCASWMLNGGVPTTVVSRHLGHESIKVTVDVYGDVDEASAQLAADFMDSTLN